MLLKLATFCMAALMLSGAPMSAVESPANAADGCCCGADCVCAVCLCEVNGCDCDGSCCEGDCCATGCCDAAATAACCHE